MSSFSSILIKKRWGIESKTRILVTDDDPEVLLMTAEVLRRAGYEVVEARTAQESLDSAKTNHFDLALLDVILPDGSGVAVCKHLKQMPELQNVLVLLTSGIRISSESQADGLLGGADGYIIKPISNKELVARVQSMERIKRAEDALRASHAELELRVNERTAQLSESNSLLRQEITERIAIEEKLEDSRERLRNLSNHLRKIREKERALLSRELHDELGQALTGMKMDVAWLKRRLPGDNAALLERTTSLLTLIDDAILTVQRISTSLRPPILDGIGLIDAFGTAASDFEKRTNVVCRVVAEPSEIELDKDLSVEAFRIFQEALTNVARHAEAKKVSVSLRKKDDRFVMTIKDNGKGITEKVMKDRKSIGLTGMHERAYSVRGNLTISGSPGKGTTIALDVPLGESK